jgi:hypothetical protein
MKVNKNHMVKKYILLTVLFLVVSGIFLSGCSEEKTTINKDVLLNTPKKPGQTGPRQSFSRGSRGEEVWSLEEQDERERKKHVKNAEECQKEFEQCIEACEKPACENSCMKLLAACEKELPKELQTLKKE